MRAKPYRTFNASDKADRDRPKIESFREYYNTTQARCTSLPELMIRRIYRIPNRGTSAMGKEL